MRLRTILFSLLLCLLPAVAHGQCEIYTNTYYTISTSNAPLDNGDGTYDIIVTTSLAGSATMNMDSNCPCTNCITQFNNNKQNITHFPYITNTVNGVGGSTEGPTFCAECYSSYQVSTDSGAVQPGQLIYATIGGEVDCSSAGQVFSSLLPTLELEIAYTRAKGMGTYSGCTGVASVVCDYDTFSDCDAFSSPPDMPISAVRASFPQAPPLIWECYGLGFRWYPYQTNYVFTNATTYAIKSGLDFPASCTKHANGT